MVLPVRVSTVLQLRAASQTWLRLEQKETRVGQSHESAIFNGVGLAVLFIIVLGESTHKLGGETMTRSQAGFAH
jgi:hypothetical protein